MANQVPEDDVPPREHVWPWRVSSFSDSGNCVEVRCGPRIEIRNSNDRRGPVLAFTRPEWEAFVRGVRAGEFDLDLLIEDPPEAC